MNNYIYEYYFCSKCQKLAKFPYKIPCGHNICKNCINNSTNLTCNKCDMIFSTSDIKPNQLKKQSIFDIQNLNKKNTPTKKQIISLNNKEINKVNTISNSYNTNNKIKKKRKYNETFQYTNDINYYNYKTNENYEFDLLLMKMEHNGSFSDYINEDNSQGFNLISGNYHKKQYKYY